MATSNQGVANITTNEGGGGAGGKFRKKPFRRAHQPTTPYDRPSTARRGINNPNNGSNNNASFFTKLVVDPASKLISYGAHRFFASVFRKRLPPPPPQPPEVNDDLSDELQLAVSNNQCGPQKSGGGNSSQPLHSSSSDGISDLEQLLKQKTFSRSEIDHLTELLRSRAAVEFSLGGDGKRSEETALDFGRHQMFASSPLEENINEGDRSHGVMSTPVINSRVIEDDMASPAELAKAYMGSRPCKVSPSMLGTRSQVGREDTGLLGNAPFASKPPNMWTMKTSASLGAPENGFMSPKSRGRSAIYNMARTPYSRVNPLSIHKGFGLTNNGCGGLSMSSSHSLVEHNEKFEPKPMAIKRRSSVLDDDLGSIGPIRRIRQKPNLLASRIPVTARGVEIGSESVLVSSKQRLPLSVELKNRVSKTVGENEDDSIPSASYTHVPSRSSEVAARILQHLEKLSPKEKSSESKLVTAREKSSFRLTPSMLRGQALRSMEDVDSSKLLLDVHDDHKLEDRSTATLPDARNSTSQKLGKLEENGPKESVVRSGILNPVMKNDFVESLKDPGPSTGTADSVVKNDVTQPPQKKRAFRMSAQEDSLEQEDDVYLYGLAPRSLAEGRGPTEAPLVDNKLSLAEELKLVKNTIQPEVMLPLGLISSKTSGSASPGAFMVGEGSGGIAVSSLEEASAAIQSEVLPHSVTSLDKLKGTNDSPPLFSFSTKTVDNLPPLPSESSSKKPESKSENSSSLANVVSSATGSQTKIPESDRGGNLNPLKAGDANGKSHTVPFAALNGPLVLRPPTVSFTAASSYDANQISTASSSLFTSSTSIASFGSNGTSTSTSAASSGNPFVSNVASSILGGPVFKFGVSVDPSTAVSAASTTNLSELADLKTKAEKEPNFGSSIATHSAVAPFASANSGSNTLGLSTSVSYSTANNLQGSLFGSASKSLVSGVGAVSQSTSNQFVSLASLPSLNMNNSASFGSSLSNSQFNPSQNFGFSSLASSSDTGAVISGSGPISSVGKFGATSAVSDGNAVSSSAGASPGIFSFGFSSSSSSASAIGSSNGATPPVSNFGGSSVATSLINTASSFSSGTSGIFNFDASSSASSSAINSLSSNSIASNIFGSTWESPKSSIFGSTLTSPSPSTRFPYGASTTFAPTNAASMVFNSSASPSSGPIFSFTTASSPALSSPSPSLTQPLFGIKPSSFASSPGNGDQMSAEDSMAEDPVQSSAPSIAVFGQPAVSPSLPGFMFESTVPSLANPFQFGGQQNQIAPQNPSPFQASGSLEFNAGGSFSLGSGGTDKSSRKFVKVNRNKNRKK